MVIFQFVFWDSLPEGSVIQYGNLLSGYLT